MAKIIDLDELLGEPKKVRLGGRVWVLPPDLPVELYLRIVKLNEEGAGEGDLVEALYEQLLELFRYKEPKLKELPVGMNQLVTAVALIYGQADDGEGDAVPPRKRQSGGAASSSRNAPTRSQR